MGLDFFKFSGPLCKAFQVTIDFYDDNDKYISDHGVPAGIKWLRYDDVYPITEDKDSFMKKSRQCQLNKITGRIQDIFGMRLIPNYSWQTGTSKIIFRMEIVKKGIILDADDDENNI